MALSNTTVWEVRTSGSDTNGGGWHVDSNSATPLAPTLGTTTTSGSIPASRTVYIQISYTDSVAAISTASPVSNVTTGSGTNTNKVTVAQNGSAPSGVSSWNIYCASGAAGPFWLINNGISIATSSFAISNMPPVTGVSALSTPSAPTCTPSSSGGFMSAGTYYFTVALIDSNGDYTAISSSTSAVTTGSTGSVSVTAPSQGSAVGWVVCGGTVSTGPFWIVGKSTSFTSILITSNPPTSSSSQPRGTDYSQQDSAQLSLTDIACSAGSANITSATGGFTYQMLGNVIQLQGTNAGFYEMTVFNSSNSVNVDRTLTNTATGVTGSLGGAIGIYAASQTQSTSGQTGNKIFVKTGTYTLPTSGNGSGGITFANPSVTPSNSNANQPLRVEGYYATRGDLGNNAGSDARPNIVLQTSGVGTPVVLKFNAQGVYLSNIKVDCASVTTSTGLTMPSYSHTENCKVSNFTTAGINVTGASNSWIAGTEVTGGGSGANAAIYSTSQYPVVYGCNIHSNACIGILSPGLTALFNLIYSNTGATSDGIKMSGSNQMILINNTIDSNGQYGINMTSGSINPGSLIKNNLITNNVNRGFAYGTSPGVPFGYFCDNNAYYNNNSSTTYSSQFLFTNTGGVSQSGTWVTNDKNLGVDPYTAIGSANFTLNNTPNGGQSCRAVGVPKTLPGNTHTSDLDMGVYHVLESGGSGSLVGISVGRLIGGV